MYHLEPLGILASYGKCECTHGAYRKTLHSTTKSKAPRDRTMQFQQPGKRLSKLVREKKRSTRLSPRRTTPLRFESLEERRVMSCQAVLDFSGPWLPVDDLESSGWVGGANEPTYNGGPIATQPFHELFTSDRHFLDFDGDGRVELDDDAELAISRIANAVGQYYSPYDLDVSVDNRPESRCIDQRVLYDRDQLGNVIVVVTTWTEDLRKLHLLPYFAGGSTNHDRFNRSNDLVFVNAESLLRTVERLQNQVHAPDGWGVAYTESQLADIFVARVAKAVAHEMGHSFGLAHPDEERTGDPRYDANLMRQGIIDEFSDVSLLDVSYVDKHGDRKNAHQHLSDPDILGPSESVWAAMLRPGVLTIQGNELDNQITVTPQSDASWSVALGSSYTSQDCAWGYSKRNVITNPEQLTQIRIYGDGGADNIDVSPDISVQVYAYGGEGGDVIAGGGGIDYLYGNGGEDFLYGRGGRDRLYGGTGNDYLFGGTGNDYLYGQLGSDRLYGMEGADRLWGADSWRRHDGDFDLLNGGSVGANSGGRRPDYRFLGLSDPYVDVFYTAIGEDRVADDRGNDVLVSDRSWQYFVSDPAQPKK